MNVKKQLAYDHPFPTRLRELVDRKRGDQGRLARYLGKTSQSVGYYKDGSTLPDCTVLAAIADYYGVSTDYLLGRTDTASPDVTVRAAARRFGLSEGALAAVEGLDAERREALDRLLTSPHLPDVLVSLVKCRAAYTGPKREKLLRQLDGPAGKDWNAVILREEDPVKARAMWQWVRNGERAVKILENSGEERADAALAALQRAVGRVGEDQVADSLRLAEAMTEDDARDYIWTVLLSTGEEG